MFALQVDSKKFMKDMNNIVAYSEGFLEGAKKGKGLMFNFLGKELKEIVGEFIDASARVDPSSLHHVYEWYQTGNKNGRLFDITYTVSNLGLSLYGTLTQSTTIRDGSKEPFYNKAKIMESGIPVTISPKTASKLVFDVDGKTVFTSSPVTVSNPGGDNVSGSFAETFKSYIMTYLSQSLLDISGLSKNLGNPVDFKTNFAAGKNGGRSVGVRVGMQWISKGGQ
jgi:hypothetical protein